MSAKEQFETSLNIRLDWSEMDLFGHINNVSFFKFVQSSRVHYWESIEMDIEHKKTNIGPLLASTKCDFKKPLFYPGSVTIYARVSSIGNTSFTIEHQLENDNGEIVAHAWDIIVMYDYSQETKVPVPPLMRERIANLQKINK